MLHGQRVLIVEDEVLIAFDLASQFVKMGAEVVGPARSVPQAMRLLSIRHAIHAAVVDLSLGDCPAFPLADRLRAAGIPFLFTTGFSGSAIPDAYGDIPCVHKPADARDVCSAVEAMLTGPRGR